MSESKTWEMAKGLANIKYFFERWVQWPGLGTVSLHVSRHVSLCSSLFVHASCFSLCSCSLATRQGKTICSPAHVVSLFLLSSFLSFFLSLIGLSAKRNLNQHSEQGLSIADSSSDIEKGGKAE